MCLVTFMRMGLKILLVPGPTEPIMSRGAQKTYAEIKKQ